MATSRPPAGSRSKQASSSPGWVSPPPMKIAAGSGAPSNASGAAPRTSTLTPNAVDIVAMRVTALLVAFERHRRAAGPAAAPFDGDAARARTDVPQQLARPRRQRRQRDGAHRLLGDLPVVGERVVGQRREPPVVGQVPHRDDVEVVDVAGRRVPPTRRAMPSTAPLRRAAELLEHA